MAFGIDGLDDFELVKERASDTMSDIVNDPSFITVLEGKKGTHSLRKYVTSKARNSGCHKDETDHRARWKARKRQQDSYCDTTIPTVDAKVAGKLCREGPIFYHLKEE